jgi:hypothetical protein
MKRFLLATVGVLLGASMALAQAQAPERWFHVRVDSNDAKGEIVRVNLPMSVAEAVLPAVHAHGLNEGKVTIHGHHADDVDLRAILEAVSKSPDNEFVTVQSKEENVRVAKSGEYILIKVVGSKWHKAKNKDNDDENVKPSPEEVNVKVPMTVVKALLTDVDESNELNVLAALKALKTFGDLDLVTVKDGDQTVRVWVDSKNVAD